MSTPLPPQQRLEAPANSSLEVDFASPFDNLNEATLSVLYLPPNGTTPQEWSGDKVSYTGKSVVLTLEATDLPTAGDWLLNPKVTIGSKVWLFRLALILYVRPNLAKVPGPVGFP